MDNYKGADMSVITVFDPAMCCSTGVCGPKPDQKLSRFAADLKSLEAEGHEVIRHNLAHEPASFARNVLVKSLIGEFRKEALPIVLVDGELGSRGVYPSREELLCMANGRLDAPMVPEAKQGCCQGQCC